MNELLKKIVKHNPVSAPIAESELFNERELTELYVLAMNIIFSGRLRGGMGSGLHFWAAPSKHFKTLFALICVSAYLKKYPDAFCLFYDTEFGSTLGYWKSAGIDLERVVHIPIKDVEQFKFDVIGKLEMIAEDNAKKKNKQKCIILVDSIGNMASKKELQDAIDEKSVADMSRAKALKGLFRILTPYLTLEQIPCLMINHVYLEQGAMYPKTIMSGGTGGIYGATNIFFVGKAQEKSKEKGEKTETLKGFTFKVKTEKSRYVKEQSVVPITVNFKGGISKYTGLFEIGMALGSIKMTSKGWYTRDLCDPETGEVIEDKVWRRKDMNAEWWETLIAKSDFEKRVEAAFRLPEQDIISQDQIAIAIDEEDEDDE